jgi:hypothetical protein
MTRVRRLRVQLPPDLYAALAAEAKAQNVLVNELIRRAVRADLRRSQAALDRRRLRAAPISPGATRRP